MKVDSTIPRFFIVPFASVGKKRLVIWITVCVGLVRRHPLENWAALSRRFSGNIQDAASVRLVYNLRYLCQIGRVFRKILETSGLEAISLESKG